MYGYEWTGQNGIYRLSVNSKIEKEIRPVFKEELDYFGFNEHWTYPDTDAPLLWAEGIRRYILNGTCVAEAMGGGFYTKPTIKIYTEGLNLEPIDVDALWKENERLMLGLEKTSMDFIRKTHDKYEKQGMAFAVAFSGGKDSLVLLDLVSRTLSPDEFSVVFSNTGMELSTTIQSVEKAKKHWPSLKFYEAKSHLKPTDSWEEFGPPGRRMRWCCAVHKSVPTILLLRELTGNYNIKVVVFDGVRAEESAARADRDEISVGAKNINQMLEDKVRDVFSDMVVLKNPERTEFFSNLSLPSYMRDWLVMKFSDDDGIIDYDSVLRYIRQYIPSREDFEQFKFEMVNGETVRFLARIRVNVDIKTGKTLFELPDFGGTRSGASGEVANDVVSRWKETLLKESENWGIVELIWGKDYSSRQGKGVIKLIEYSPFCPYTVDLEFYKEARRAFTLEEWIDVLISAADYNPAGYDSEQQKLYVLRRLLPFVEKRLNLMELAPKGTGKSYVYQKISKRGWLISGGTVSRASLIYDNQKKTGGLLTRFDFVGFDEIQSMTFDKPSQIQTALKDYMEFGEVQGFDAQIVADAGVIVLGNINASRFNVNENMMEEVSSVFSESASLDRFHGFIPGWKIPRMHQGLVANGWALNTEYFAEVLHLLRDDLTYTTIVDECLAVPAKPDKRDLTAIKRLCTAFVKLLYPNATCKDDIPADEFIKYCLEPAKEMRGVIKKQLCIIDPKEFNVPGKKDIPDIQYNYM